MKDDDAIEIIDLSPDSSDDETVGDFLKEQMRHLDAMIADVNMNPSDEKVEEVAAYVRGASSAADDAIVEAWPELRDTGSFSLENFRKVTMTAALCGVIIQKGQLLMRESDTGLKSIGLMISLQMQALATSGVGPPTKVVQAVTVRATADELLNRAKKAEREEQEG